MSKEAQDVRKHNHYFRSCPYANIDVYRIIDIFEITCPAAQHVLKKVIATGKRGHKDVKRDWEDIIDSAQRKLEMLEEDAQPVLPKKWPDDLMDAAMPLIRADHGNPPTYDFPTGVVPKAKPTPPPTTEYISKGANA
jgi:hypothetical protein